MFQNIAELSTVRGQLPNESSCILPISFYITDTFIPKLRRAPAGFRQHRQWRSRIQASEPHLVVRQEIKRPTFPACDLREFKKAFLARNSRAEHAQLFAARDKHALYSNTDSDCINLP